MAYEEKYRKKVLEYLNKGHSQREAQEAFGVGTTTMKRWRKQYEETGSLVKKELRRSFKKIDPARLAAYIKEHPDAYLKEIAEVFKCNPSSIRKALIKLKITRKKNERVSGAQ